MDGAVRHFLVRLEGYWWNALVGTHIFFEFVLFVRWAVLASAQGAFHVGIGVTLANFDLGAHDCFHSVGRLFWTIKNIVFIIF